MWSKAILDSQSINSPLGVRAAHGAGILPPGRHRSVAGLWVGYRLLSGLLWPQLSLCRFSCPALEPSPTLGVVLTGYLHLGVLPPAGPGSPHASHVVSFLRRLFKIKANGLSCTRQEKCSRCCISVSLKYLLLLSVYMWQNWLTFPLKCAFAPSLPSRWLFPLLFF